MQYQRVAVIMSGGILAFYVLLAAMCSRSANGWVCVYFVPLVAYFLLQDKWPMQTGRLFHTIWRKAPSCFECGMLMV